MPLSITTGGKSTAAGTSAASSMSWTHTVGANDQLLVVGVAMRSANTTGNIVSSIRFGGTGVGSTLTLRVAKRTTGATSNAMRVELWTLANPSTGLTTLVEVQFNNASQTFSPKGIAVGFQNTSAVAASNVGTSFSASGAIAASVVLPQKDSWPIGLIASSGTWSTAAGTGETILAAAASAVSLVMLLGNTGASGAVAMTASHTSAGLGARVGLALLANPGPSSFAVSAAALSTVTVAQTVRRNYAPSVLGSASVIAVNTVQHKYAPTIAAVSSAVSALTVSHRFAPTIEAAVTVTSTLTLFHPAGPVTFAPAVTVVATVTASDSIGRAFAPIVAGIVDVAVVDTAQKVFAPSVAGQAVVDAALSVWRSFAPSVEVLVTLDSVLTVESGAPPPEPEVDRGGTGVSRRARDVRNKIAALRRPRGRPGRGGPAPDYEIDDFYPGDTPKEVDQLLRAESVRQETLERLAREDEAERTRMLLNLELGRRRQRLDRGLPPAVPRSPTKDKLLQDLLSRKEKEDNWNRKATMARVRSFKKKA